MILDYTKNIELYAPVLKNLDKALAAIQALPTLEPGRYEFDGGYFMIQTGTTNPMEPGDYEAHRKYIDVQMILEGSELVAWKELSETTLVEYSEEKDFAVCSGPIEEVVNVKEGMFYAVYPHDAHKPCRHFDTPTTYKKAVIKLPV